MKIQEDSYWYVDKNNIGQQSMQAMCMNCREEFKNAEKEFGWKWEGTKLGYGDYDLSCALCKKVIYQREQNDNKNKEESEDQTTIQDK
ncbi:MAG: hypothetical protein ACW99G_06985 [Candidatus Thorarchaeota archaeon]|jgi:hypothetical protein